LGKSKGILAVALATEAECFETLEEKEGTERIQTWANVSKKLIWGSERHYDKY
jgi:hypothetical protein